MLANVSKITINLLWVLILVIFFAKKRTELDEKPTFYKNFDIVIHNLWLFFLIDPENVSENQFHQIQANWIVLAK